MAAIMIVILQCLNVKRAKCREFMRGFIISILLLGFTPGTFAQNLADNAIEVEAKGSYLMGVGNSKQLARQLALFEAKRSALETAGKYLTHKSLIPFYEMKKEEIYSLAARETQGEIVEERWEPIGKTIKCLIRIRAKVQISDFIKAEIQNQKLEKEDEKESLLEEMDPVLSKEIDPGKDIARAYRLLRKKEWRMAMIYLDHLEKKYPNWGNIYMAKAIAFYAFNEPLEMKKALEMACHLGKNRACDDLRSLKKIHNLDLAP
jgi:tetratricopeptide (TPR) repeat protein